MTIREVINGLKDERKCVSSTCELNCENCELLKDKNKEYMLSVYDSAIAILEVQAKKEEELEERKQRRREKNRIYNIEWAKKNPEKRKMYKKNWVKNNPEKVKAQQTRHRERKRQELNKAIPHE